MAENGSLEKVEPLWFSLDAVVLRADTRVFRVFAAILRAQSSVFADMFTFPQQMETMDGISVVKLHDNPDDKRLQLLTCLNSFFVPPPANPEFGHIIGILRLSHKYNVPYLRRRALDHLGTMYPMSLLHFDCTLAEGPQHWIPSTVFAVLRVCEEVGAPWLLPAAYHCLCQLLIAVLV
ncbi:hypothetical protein B0H17DRAFT_931620 [Mycena rosella]|uniref:BTB domain-containing protein n=1 Tax=Mycena rosella TaxID=1033263 RepID=A0AAD7DM35_MYCRO|nr:hypothetical protein B0H17DRAFT_931620 [Mycena rosella]